MAIQIGKYKRPGIFIEEIDKSVFSTSVTEGITNLVIGVSKKGPVNTPIRLTNVTDLEAVFGQLDRNLERKGSFFHRTVSKMLETTPVYAMNLLLTDDTLDKIEYKSLSTSSFNKNDIKREGPYRRFFDTTGFWKRDTESFINLTKGDVGYTERALGFTNLSDRYITVFVVKTAVSGFDRTLLEWYGSIEKMPAYVSSIDYASDYMVDVVIVGGDWSNYQELAVDTRWSAYFNTQGLIKEQLRNFANDRNITLLSYYEGLSLIPYFRDLNGRNIFIETTINRDTDTTGLFCSFNAELVEKDFYTGLVDLVGNTLVGTSETEVDFLSYKEKISENVEFTQVPLDLPGNVSSLFGNIFGVTGSLLSSITTNTKTATIGSYTASLTGGYGTGVTASVLVQSNGKLVVDTIFSVDNNTIDAIVGTYNTELGTNGAFADVVTDYNSSLKVGYELLGSIPTITGATTTGSPFTFTFSGGASPSATAQVAIGTGGTVSSFIITSEGYGYTPGMNMIIATGSFGITSSYSFSLTASAFQVEVTSVEVTSEGSGYVIGGIYSIDSAVIGGSTDPYITVATASVQRVVTGINIINSSENYQVGDNLTISNSIIGGGTNVVVKLVEEDLVSVSKTTYNGQLPHAFQIPTQTGVVMNGENRTGYFGEGSVYELTRENLVSTTTSITVDYVAGVNAFAIIGGSYLALTNTTLSIDSLNYVNKLTAATYSSAFIVNSSGVISVVNSFVTNVNPTVSTNDIVLGYVTFSIVSGVINTSTLVFTDVTVNTEGYKDFSFGSNSLCDFNVTEVTTSGFTKSFKVEFIGTNTTSDNTSNYKEHRRFKMFNRLVSIIDSTNKSKVSMLVDSTNYEKYSLVDATITNIVTSTSLNKSFVLNTNLVNIDEILKGFLVFYTEDNEFILGADGVITTDVIADTNPGGLGVVAKYSDFYLDFYNGNINTGDFFYNNRLYLDNNGDANIYAQTGETVGVVFINGETATSVTSVYAGHNYIIFDGVSFNNVVDLNVLENIIFPTSSLNTGTFTITDNTATIENASQLATSLGYTGYYAYEVSQNVTTETLTSVSVFYDYDVKHYLRMYLDTTGNLNVGFKDILLSSTESVDTLSCNTIYVQSAKSNLKETIEIELPTGYIQVPNKILVNGSRYTELKVGDFLEADTTDVVLEVGQVARKLTRVLSKRQYVGDTTLSEISCDAKIALSGYNGDYQATRYSSIDQYTTTYKAIAMKGFRIRQASMPDGTEAKQNQVLNLVAKGTPLFKSLINKEAFDFRYLIDSFGLGLVERSKQQLVDICGERLDVFGFLNMPSIRAFKNSSSPSFVNSEGVLQVEFIAKGGDPESNPAFLYSFGEGVGTTCVGYFTPYITVNDNGRPLDFPPASYVATTYIRKHISNISSVTPWTIAAGVTNGRVTNIAGLEIDFDPTDIEFLNTAQMNPIVLKRNRGYVIETENTALVLYKSALSLVHVREVLIELERELSRMLLDYQWKFNTPDVRAEIKLRADVICETYVSKNGLYNYFNKMDDENNTADVIDNQIGVLDTYVEPIKGMGIIVNNITILRTGAIAAGGFLNA